MLNRTYHGHGDFLLLASTVQLDVTRDTGAPKSSFRVSYKNLTSYPC